MQLSTTHGNKSRRMRAKTLFGTLAATAAIAGGVMPAALPANASAMRAISNCDMLVNNAVAALRAGNWDLFSWYMDRYNSLLCSI
jgi:hypothetical protein